MSLLYVANTTKQHHDFLYQIPELEKYRLGVQKIPAGQQVVIYKDAPLPVIEAIIKQHEKYGLMPVDDVVKTKGFVGLCYSIDKPVPLDKLHHAFDHNLGVLHDRSEQMKKEAAIAIGGQVENHLGGPVESLEVEIVEEGTIRSLPLGLR